jgi:hypothetical protein
MATDIVQSLFGVTPDMYDQVQQAQADARALQYAKLNPFEQANFAIGRGASMLGGAIGRSLGGEDPERRKIQLQQQLLSGVDLSNPTSLIQGAKDANNMGLSVLASNLVDRAKALQESSGRVAAQQAQLLTAMQPPKVTGDERYINILQNLETIYASGKEPTATQLSLGNMAGQMLSKPRSFLDAASGQMITQPATDPSKAFPLTFKAMGVSTEGGVTTVPKPTVQQATTGNLPSGSQTEIGVIDANLTKLEQSGPELQSFLGSLKSNEVKYNAKDNTFDFLGAIIPPAFGFKERGGQVKKDEIKRALTERVNTLLLMAKGTQTEGDATRAKDQIASDTTFLSQARMIGAIEGLERTEKKLQAELLAKKRALQSKGRTDEPGVTTAKPTEEKAVVAPVNQATPSAPKQPSAPAGLTREQKIQRFIEFNGGRPTRQEAEQALRNAGKL